MSNPQDKLKDFKPTKGFFVGIDSDGCVFDTMEIKHKECFCPAYINHFGLQAASKYAREVRKTGDPDLKTALEWSKDVNAAVKKIVRDVPPFPFVRESLDKITPKADVIVVSRVRMKPRWPPSLKDTCLPCRRGRNNPLNIGPTPAGLTEVGPMSILPYPTYHCQLHGSPVSCHTFPVHCPAVPVLTPQ